MTIRNSTMRNVSTATILAVFLGLGSMAGAATDKKPAPPPPPPRQAAPAPRPAPQPAARPAGNPGGARPVTTTTPGTRPITTTTGTTAPVSDRSRQNVLGSTAASSHSRNAANPTPIRGGPAPKGSNERVTKDGSAVRVGPKGNVRDVHDAKRGMDVHHGLNGNRRVSVERPDHSRLVAERGRPGYVQRGYSYHATILAGGPTTTMAMNITATTAGMGTGECIWMSTLRDSIMARPFMVGPTTPGARRLPMDGDGGRAPGTGIMAATLRRTPFTPAPRPG